jgi:PilZ domain
MNRLTVGQTAALSVGDTVADCQVVARTGGEAVLVPHEPKIAARLPAAGDGASLVFKHGDRLVMLRGAMYRGTSDDDLRFAERTASRAAPVAGDHRRKAARLPVTLPVTMRQLDEDGTPFGEGRQLVTRDISLGGFAVGTGVGAFSPGALVTFELVLISREVIAGRARVVRAGSEMSAMCFEHLEPADRIRLVGFLASLRARAGVSRATA